jgi:hypothetical protein
MDPPEKKMEVKAISENSKTAAEVALMSHLKVVPHYKPSGLRRHGTDARSLSFQLSDFNNQRVPAKRRLTAESFMGSDIALPADLPPSPREPRQPRA